MKKAETRMAFKIRGMDCAEEIAVLKLEVGPLVGGEDRLGFDLLKARMTVFSPPQGLAEQEVVQAVERTGMGAQVWRAGSDEVDKEGVWQRRGRTILAAVSGLGALAGFATHAVLAGGSSRALGSEGMGVAEAGVPLTARAFYLLAILAGLWTVAPKAWFAVRRFRPDMNLLMTVAVLGAVTIGEWFEGATVAFLFAVSLALEAWSVGRARRAVAALLDLSPATARLLRPDGREEEVPAGQVEVGARFVVRPGEKVPVDGTVIEGHSSFD